MNNEFQVILNLLCCTMPFNIIAYYPFWNNLRCRKSIVVLTLAATEIISFAAAVLFLRNGINPKWAEYIFEVFYYVWFCLCINIKVEKLTFFYVFMAEYVIIIRGISTFAVSIVFSGEATNYYSWQNTVTLALVFVIMLPLVIKFFNSLAERVIYSDDSPIWKIIWLVPAFTVVIIQVFTGSLDSSVTSSWTFMATRLLMIFGSFCVYYILLGALEDSRARAVAEEQARQAEALNDLQKSQYNLMKKRMEETRIARHDLRQHLNLIQAYLDNGDNEALENYLNEYRKSLPTDTTESYCGNYTVDVVMRYYGGQAKPLGIKFDTRIDIPEDIEVAEPDVCVIFGNLLENALEACGSQQSGKKFIRTRAKIIGKKAISLTVDNSCDRQPTENGESYLSSKRDGTGIGLISVRNIAKKYNGVADFSYKDGVFYASVLLNP